MGEVFFFIFIGVGILILPFLLLLILLVRTGRIERKLDELTRELRIEKFAERRRAIAAANATTPARSPLGDSPDRTGGTATVDSGDHTAPIDPTASHHETTPPPPPTDITAVTLQCVPSSPVDIPPFPPFPPEKKPQHPEVLSTLPAAAFQETVLEKIEPSHQQPEAPSFSERTAQGVLDRIWNWIVVGEEHRSEEVTTEYAVATTWLVRIGVLILLTGIGFFLRYAAVQGWISPGARVIAACITGIALIAGGLHLFSGRYSILGQGLCGAGFATLYLSLFTAQLSNYELLSPAIAFALMILVTAAAGIIAVRRESLLIAVIGTLGGFWTPLLVSPSEKSLLPLLSYLLLLNLGMFAIAARRNWRVLHYLAFVATMLYIGFWVMPEYTWTIQFWQLFPFLLGFFVLFSSVTFVYQILHRENSTLLELLFLFLNSLLLGASMLHTIDTAYPGRAKAILTIGLALFYAVHLLIFRRRQLQDVGLQNSFLVLASFFAALSLPILISKGWLTVSWSLQAFAMLWLAFRLDSKFLRKLAYILYLIVFLRFGLFDLSNEFTYVGSYSGGEYALQLLNRLCIFGIPVASVFAASWLFTKVPEDGGNDAPSPINGQTSLSLERVCFWLGLGLLFVYLNREGHATFGYISKAFINPGITIIWVGFGLVILHELYTRGSQLARALLWGVLFLLFGKVFLYNFIFSADVLRLIFPKDHFTSGVLMRFFDYVSVIAFFAFVSQVGFRTSAGKGLRGFAAAFGYAALLGTFVYTSLELWSMLYHFFHPSRLVGLSIYWALFAAALLLIGIIWKHASLRGLGLTLLAVTIIKVLLVDLGQLEPLYRIIGFLVIGVIVLAGSFFYFRFGQHFSTDTRSSSSAGEPREKADRD